MLKLWDDLGRDARWVMWSYLLWGVGEGLWMYIQPLYLKSLGATPTQTGLALGMWGLARLLFILPAGILADRWGPYRLMRPGWYLGLAGVVIIAFAPNWQWTMPGFLVYGMSSAAIPVTSLYLAQSARFDATRHPNLPIQSSLTFLWAAYAIGLVVSPSVGGWIGDQVNLRAVFLFSLIGFGLSTWAIRHIHRYPPLPRPERGYNYMGLLRRREIISIFGLLTLAFVAIYTGQTLAPQYLSDVRRCSNTLVGIFGSFNALGTTVFSLAMGRLSAWRAFFASLLLVMLSFSLLLLTGILPLIAVAYFMLGAYNTARPLGVSIISERVAEHQRGMGYALFETLAGLAVVVGTLLSGLLYATDPGWPFMAGLVGGALVLLLAGWLVRPHITSGVFTYSKAE